MEKPWVIKAGGELLVQPVARAQLLRDLASLARRHPVVFLHGGGPQIEQELERHHIPVQFVEGRRVTTSEAMVIVERVLSGEINKGLVGDLNHMRIKAVGLSCRDGGLIVGRPVPLLGRAAKPAKVNPDLLSTLLKQKFLPVVSSVASDSGGHAVNINADEAVSALAAALKARHLIFLTNVDGVKGENGQVIHTLRLNQVRPLIENNVIIGGMIPKVQSALLAIKKGVSEVNIVNGFNGISVSSGTAICR